MNLRSGLFVLFGVVAVTGSVAALPWMRAGSLWPGVLDRDGSTRLPNGERIQPAGETRIALHGDLPLALVQGANGKRIYALTGGYHDHGIANINLGDLVCDSYLPTTKCAGGIVETGDGFGYFTAGDLGIRKFIVSSNRDQWQTMGFKLPKNAWLQGLGVLKDGSLVASDINNDSVICFDPASLDTKWSTAVGHRPNRIAVDPVTNRVAVTNWGGSSISILSPSGVVEKQIAVGVHPSEVLFARSGDLFVSNAGSNSVSIIRDGLVAATVFTSLSPNDLIGSTPTGLALSPDQKELFVANSGSNNIAEIDLTDPNNPKVKGFIPTGWYPSTVAVPSDGKRLIVGTAKGLLTTPNFPGTKNEQTLTDDLRNRYDYLPNKLEGDLKFIEMPTDSELAKMTATCQRNAQREMSEALLNREKQLIPTLRKIKHVLYIIRENRSYDQVLGDLPGTNAEPSLCMYGEKITPNGHKIARTFKTFDNLYCDGEVSQDGHQWCCSSYCTDFTEKAWPTGYADRGRPDDDDSVTASPGGYLWDNCRKNGLTYRSYGEFGGFTSNKASAPVFHGSAGLEGHASAVWSLSDDRDKDRADIFIQEMHDAEKANNWPNFMVMSLGEDHTAGRSAGEFTPFSKVASNDVGLGKIVDAISHSKFWAETAIFVIEDDAQDGPDHVDGHRTVGYTISPYINRGGADHTLYSTASMVRTIELILGLPPMSQHDRHATSMVASFTAKTDLTPFNYEKERIDLSARNPKDGVLAMLSAKLDFSHYDRVEPGVLNQILWEDAKPGIPYPKSSHLSR